MSNNNGKVDNRNASQKIQDLENAMMSLYQTADNMARDMINIRELIKLLGNKVDSIVKASSKGEAINDAVIDRIMIENKCEEMAEGVRKWVAQGVLVPAEQVNDNSFVVGREEDWEGNVVNARLQFALAAVQPDLKSKINGAKTGETIITMENKFKFKIVETYDLQQPKPVVQEAPANAEEPTQAESAPANA